MLLQRLVLVLVPALAALAALAAPTTSLASCAMSPDIKVAVASADVAFVGTVTGTINDGTWATVSVEEIWQGPDQPTEVTIKGGPGGNAATSVDRAFEIGVKYLFFPHLDPAQGLTDNSCSPTTQWSADLAAFRPTVTRTPGGVAAAETGPDFGGLVGPFAVAVVVSGVLLAVGLLARSRQAS
jgi:hypothetical protein